ncbi:MAG TPA: alpha/beta fold hydrolase [Candidatus Saccharimonadales bacterium]|nr:alpha/beta fold hydrolase [Candidatus Saccharimonadales bacterium]
MKRHGMACILFLFLFSFKAEAQGAASLEQLLGAPFPENLTAAKSVNRVAWAVFQQGKRSIWAAEGPQFTARLLVKYDDDDGQELSELSFAPDGNTLTYVRGGGKNSAGQSPNPTSNPAGTEQAVWTVSWSGGEAKRIDAGFLPKISARGSVAYVHDGQIWTAPADGSEKPFHIAARGQNFSPVWSPDATRLAFVSTRGDHAFIAVYDVAAKTVRFIAPTVDSDGDVVWSTDGTRLAFVRQPAERRDAPQGYFLAPDKPHPWAIWIADATSGNAREIWHSSATPQGSYPYMGAETGGGAIQWAADNHLIIPSEEDGWQHVYSLSVDGGAAKLLTPGNCEAEQWSLTPDGKSLIFNSNCGDIDRRHLWQTSISSGVPVKLSEGNGIEWGGVAPGDGSAYVFIGSDAQHPGRVFSARFGNDKSRKELTADLTPKDFPAQQLVTPQQVIFKSADGWDIHGQLFQPANAKPGEKRPAVIFMHGGPMREMLLGWHYMFYYSNCYAMNQYLASRGYTVLSVNYRSGVGYGRAFREAPGRAGRGATEYQDIVAAGKFLQSRNDIDAQHIGLWGGSYGGYLTAMGLGRNSDIFAAGVDIHGVHDWPTDNWDGKNISPELYKLAHDSSPVNAVEKWRSPVLFIHGDDDRNVYFTQSVDLVSRLREKGGVEIEQLIFPDEIHDFLLYRNWLAAYHAASDFFDRRLKPAGK